MTKQPYPYEILRPYASLTIFVARVQQNQAWQKQKM